MKGIVLFTASFLYTWSYVAVLDVDIFIFDFFSKRSEDGSVYSDDLRSATILLIIALNVVVVILVVLLFRKIQGYFTCIYTSSLLASFLMPLYFDSLSKGSFFKFSWWVDGIILTVLNLIGGFAMFFLLSYFVVKKFNMD